MRTAGGAFWLWARGWSSLLVGAIVYNKGFGKLYGKEFRFMGRSVALQVSRLKIEGKWNWIVVIELSQESYEHVLFSVDVGIGWRNE